MPICIAATCTRRFLFLAYCLRFDDSTIRDQRRASDKLAPIRSIDKNWLLLVHKIIPQVLVAHLMRAYKDFEEDAASNNIFQTSQAKMPSRCMFWPTANLSILLVPKYTQEQALIYVVYQYRPKRSDPSGYEFDSAYLRDKKKHKHR